MDPVTAAQARLERELAVRQAKLDAYATQVAAAEAEGRALPKGRRVTNPAATVETVNGHLKDRIGLRRFSSVMGRAHKRHVPKDAFVALSATKGAFGTSPNDS